MESSKTVTTPTSGAPAKSWWREPMMWLVVGGPSIVVVASFVTLGLALHFPDPALDAQEIAASNKSGSAAHAPAVKARNHAATGGQ